MTPIQCLGGILENHQPYLIAPQGRTQAAVALVLEEKPEGLSVLFIERSANEHDYWSRQIGFPGGRAEDADPDPRATAERETREELGLDLADARYLGRLSDIAPGGLGIVISCFVYALDHRPPLTPDPREIAGTLWIPVPELYNPARRQQVEFVMRNRLRVFPGVKLTDGEEQPLWGITYRLLRSLHKIATPCLESGGVTHS